MSIAVLFTVTKTQRQARRPWTEEWTQSVQRSSTMDCCSAARKNEIMAFAATWMDLGNLREKKRNMVWYCLFVKSPPQKMIQRNLFAKQKYAAQLASIRQMRGQVSHGSAGEYQADEQ